MESPASAHKVALLEPGVRLGRYYLLGRLAIGGMAELHLACAEGVAGFQKVVVLKRVLPNLAQDRDFIALFLNEARLAANLDHPNLVQVMDIGQEGDEYYYVMEYVHGHNVREVLAAASKRDGLPLQVALTIVMAVATGLHHAHERVDLDGRPLGLVHRDVSPANVLVSYDGAVKVTDFGIAKASARSTETIGGAMKGKIGYMSPEQCRGEAVDRRSDVFALGILLFELTTTQRLFYADNDFAILNKILQGQFDPPSQRVQGYPPELETIVLRALSPRPSDRYRTAGELVRALESFAHEAHQRCTTATLADWMLETFGPQPYPRVELLPPKPEDPLERIPTLLLAGESMSGADPGAVTRHDDPRWSPENIAESTEARRSRTPAFVGAVAIVSALGLGAAWAWPSAEPTESGRNVDPAAPVVAAEPTQPEPTRPEPTQPERSGEADEPDPPGSQPPDEAAALPDPPAAADPGAPQPERGTERKRKRKRGSTRKRSEAGDLNALYPVKG